MKKFLLQMLSEDNGNPSSMRAGLIFVATVIMVNWTLANFGVCQWHPLSLGDMGSLISVFAAKAYSKKLEPAL